MDSEVPKPCRHFLGREEELDELHTLFEENRHIFLYGIAGIGKSELAKAYAKQYRKQYTNILYMEYTGNLYQNITDMDFIDDPPEISEQKRFQRHNRFLRSLKSDTLLIIDNFNVTAIIYGGQLARRKSLIYALIFPENILLTLFFMSMNTIFTYFRICENSYK